jgi:trigger factor
VVSVEGSRDGAAFPGGSSDQMPRVLGENRLYPGFDDHIVGLRKGEEREFDLTFPAAFHDEALRGATAHFKLRLKELRARVLPEADDEFARSVGKFESLDELKVELRKRLEANALDRARHDFADKIIDYAVANDTSDLPDVLVDQEVEVMHDEWRSALARQGISEDLFFQVRAMNGARGPGSGAAGEPGIAVAGQAASKEGETPSRASLEAELRADFKPGAEQRVKSLLVLSEIARLRGVEVTDLEVEVEVARARTRYADDRGMVQYFESERGRNYIRSTLRRSRAVEQLIDEWLAAHPESPRLRHLEDPNESSPVANPSPGAAEVIAATEPDNLTPQEAAAPAGA